MVEGVDKATVFCCFLTPEYEQSVECQIEFKYAKQKSMKIIPCILKDPNLWKYSEWLASSIDQLDVIPFNIFEQTPDVDDVILWLKFYMEKEIYLNTYVLSNRVHQPCYLFEIIKYEYQQNDCIKFLLNITEPLSSIEKNYINLTIVNAKTNNKCIIFSMMIPLLTLMKIFML